MINLKLFENEDGSSLASVYIHIYTDIDLETMNYRYYFKLFQDTSVKKKCPEVIYCFRKDIKGNHIRDYGLVEDKDKLYYQIAEEFLH